MKCRLAILAFVLSAVGPLLAQTAAPNPEQKASEKLQKQVLLAEQILADVPNLRLGENRAFVYAKLGSLLWKSDQKTAKVMLEKAVSELLAVQIQAEAEEKGKSNQHDLRLIQSVRPSILSAVGALDAEFALDSLYRTRTASIHRAIAQAGEQTNRISDLYGMSSTIAQTEFNLEQRLIRLAADQNPERAAKLLQETIKKGLSNETLALLKKLFGKDPEAANSLAAETLDKLLSAGFSANPADQTSVNLALAILSDFIREKKPGGKELKFDEMNIRSLATKLINFTIGQDPRYNTGRLPSLIKIAEKLAPGTLATLKKIEKNNIPPGARNFVPDSDARNLISGNATPAQILAEAKKIPAEGRAPLYQGAANKMSQSGDYNGAVELLNANFAGKALENAINSLNWFYAGHLMNQGKWTEAERLIDEFPDSNKRSALITLATRAFAKDPVENKVFAVNVLRKVRALLPERPSDQNELTQFMQLASAFAGIEPDEAFGCFDPVIPQLNEMADASAVVQAFQNTYSVRSGEFVMTTGGSYGFQFDQNLIRTLAKADFDRTVKLMDSFTRREIRIGLRLQLAETGLN